MSLGVVANRDNMKISGILLLVLLASGCSGAFSRPVPTPEEYKQQFLSHLAPENIRELQYSYHGAVGGDASIARFIADDYVIAVIRKATQSELVYKPDNGNEVQELTRQFAMCAREGRIPKWFDFPFSRSLLLFEDKGDDKDGHPAYSHRWYVDEESGIVYFVLIDG